MRIISVVARDWPRARWRWPEEHPRSRAEVALFNPGEGLVVLHAAQHGHREAPSPRAVALRDCVDKGDHGVGARLLERVIIRSTSSLTGTS
jgi:hypothetical protein